MEFNIVLLRIGLIAFFISLFSAYAVIFLSRKFNIFIDKVDVAKPQRFHTFPTPRAGGVGIFLAFGLLLFEGVNAFNIFFLIGLLIVFLSGFLEDISASLSPKIRLLIQFLGTLVAIVGMGVVIEDLSPIVILPYYLGIAFSLFGIIGVCNAINIIDGFNGLASGICAMAFIAIAIAALSVGNEFVLWVCVIGLGAEIGFKMLNFPKGKIFLGDGGAYVLGFVMAIILAVLTQSSSISAWFGLAVMIYPVWEVVFSIIRRRFGKQSSMEPDKKHLHTLIYQIIQSNPLTAVVIWIFNFPFVMFAVIFMDKAWVLIGLCVAFVMAYGWIYWLLTKRLRETI